MRKEFQSPRTGKLRAGRGRKSFLAAGLMSGTSADGIDAVLVRITPGAGAPRLRLLEFRTFPWPPGFRSFLLRNSDPETARLDEISALNILLAELFSGAVIRLARMAGIAPGRIDVIGSHGQTIGHYPRTRKLFGIPVRSTLQIGHPGLIAKRTGVTTVGDFRVGDIALGGSGAPLVPLYDYLMHRSTSLNRALLNIGGISNITVLPRAAVPGDVIAFDTGPGNMAIDSLARRFYRRAFDRDGAIASRGSILPLLLRRLSAHPYLRIAPPKSTGRETFGEHFARKAVAMAPRSRREDLVATVTEFTALSVYLGYLLHIRKKVRIDELRVSGGGAENPVLMEALRRYFAPVPVLKTGEEGIPAGAREAVCFALLGLRTLLGEHGNLPSATGAARPGILGVICPP